VVRLVRREQLLDLGQERRVVSTPLREPRRARVLRNLEGGVEQLEHVFEARGFLVHVRDSSRFSHAFANRTSFFTFAADTPSASAVSSTVMPSRRRMWSANALSRAIASSRSRASPSASASTG